jgi:hypothetical protein
LKVGRAAGIGPAKANAAGDVICTAPPVVVLWIICIDWLRVLGGKLKAVPMNK